jgi:hypothetical protein
MVGFGPVSAAVDTGMVVLVNAGHLESGAT